MSVYLQGELKHICPCCGREENKKIELKMICGMGHYESGVDFECECGHKTIVSADWDE